MRILAIETVESTGTVAALEGEQLLAQRELNPQQRSAQSLAPGIHGLLEEVGWRPTDVQLVAVASGPGSFTGLRIGVTTAKTFAYAVGCQAMGVHTLLAIASQAPREVSQFAVVLDAHRGELFVADFIRHVSGELSGQETTRIVRVQPWLESLRTGDVVTGLGLEKIIGQLPVGVRGLDQSLWAPRASTVGKVGRALYLAGHRDEVFNLLPHYFRRTAAEEQWERKQSD